MASDSSIPPIRPQWPIAGRQSGRIRESARRAEDPYPAVFRRVCAWCGLELARERRALSGEAEITTWGICPDCLELREGAGEVDASERQPKATRRCDGPEQEHRGVEGLTVHSRAADVPTDLIG